MRAADVQWLNPFKRGAKPAPLLTWYRHARRKQRQSAALDRRFISLQPAGRSHGQVLMSFINDPFYLKPGEPVPSGHTHHWDALQMAKTYLELGFGVDVIRYTNTEFVPKKDYAVFIDSRFNLERMAKLLNPDCLKIMHADAAHWLTHNLGETRRLLALQQRRQVTLRPRRYMQPNWGIEHADSAVILGNEFTLGSYRFARKPLCRLTQSTAMVYPWPADKDFSAVRNHYLWFSSHGLVHKGLDLVLEAFAGMPDLELTICAPIEREPDFAAAYHRELYDTPNIHVHGWVDVSRPEFTRLADHCLGVIYPSSSEGGGASAITCMQAGLIPVLSYEASVDVQPEYGLILPDCSIESIQAAVRSLSSQPVGTLADMARNAWAYARANHTRELFAELYRQFAASLVRGRLPEARPAAA
jgi:glycosyltransferase involved in cell wall biosynthesis